MGFFDSISDMLEAALPWSTAEAEAPKEEEEETKVGASFLAS
jgi:ubiquinol-cytochrome c reductase subunit 6